MSRRYMIWRDNHAYDERLRRIIDRTRSLNKLVVSVRSTRRMLPLSAH
jgi:hypothetical protein